MESMESYALDWLSVSYRYMQMSIYVAEMKTSQSHLRLLCCFGISLGDSAFKRLSQKEEVFLCHSCTFLYDALDFLIVCFNFVYLAAVLGENSCSCILYM